MEHRTQLVIAGAVGVSLAILVAIAPPFLRAWHCYTDWAGGEFVDGTVVRAEPETGLVVQLVDGEACTVAVGPSHLDDFERGESVPVVRRADRPGSCELASTIEASEAFLIAFAAVVVALLLVIALIAIGVERQLTQAPELTTRFDGGEGPACPRCQKPMEEGYLPLQAGVPWRRPGEPIGMVSVFHGLPGTVTGLRHRPRVHAYRCEPCEVVTFRYGRP